MAPRRREQIELHGRNRRYFVSLVLAFAALFSVPRQTSADELKQQTVAAWDGYVTSACVRAETRAKESPFLRVSELPEGRVRLRGGETLVWHEKDGHPPHVPHGLIHDWMGAIFIPNVTMADVLAVTRDYDRYSDIYSPAVVESKKHDSTETDDEFSMLLVQKVLFVTAALKGEYETRYVQMDARHWYSISHSTSLQAIENFGQPDTRALPPDRGPGYVWRLYSFARFEESDGGVYIEMEALGLSRDVPTMLRWLVDPVVDRLPRNSIRATLEETRKAVLARISRED